jgi:hypothetical protein
MVSLPLGGHSLRGYRWLFPDESGSKCTRLSDYGFFQERNRNHWNAALVDQRYWHCMDRAADVSHFEEAE